MLRTEKELRVALLDGPPVITRGSPLPLGATRARDGVNFAIFSRHATEVTLVLFYPGEDVAFQEIPLDLRFHRTGHIWHAMVKGLEPGCSYGYRMDRPGTARSRLHRFDPRIVLLDPYAKAITGHANWAREKATAFNHRRALVLDDEFDWGDDQPLNTKLSDTIIYELHVRGFTRDRSSGVAKPGTFAGLIEKIPYLLDLGVTAVELLPVHEFEELDTSRVNPLNGERLVNYWGYQPISFFAPNCAYSSKKEDGGQVREFKTLVKRFHAAGLEVILDVVFNHTAEGNHRGPTFSFRGIDNSVYYMLDAFGDYIDYSGCGNTLNCNHPVVREFITDCLRYWVMEMHVDGFRFDLASILGRGQDGSVLANPPLLETLAHDPVLAKTKLIAEAWDAAGLYQVGTFPAWSRWAEWNGKFRDDVRRFVRGEAGMVSALATRLVGSPDLYQTSNREPYHSINFVTCHDGFTLADLVTYDHKHNEANGESGADGQDENLSWNCGAEGYSEEVAIQRLRLRQRKNFATILLLADGVPMILAGDELGRTELGNNNAYCQDNEVSWVDWTLLGQNASLFRFFRLLIAFRRTHSLLRAPTYQSLAGTATRRIEWHGVRLNEPDWGGESRSIAMHLRDDPAGDSLPHHIYLILNAWWEPQTFELPAGVEWTRFVDTFIEEDGGITEPGMEKPLENPGAYRVGPRSAVVLVSRNRMTE